MGAIGRWGNSFDLDFWTAAACGEVDGPEMRAVDLLRHTTDEERFGYYCQTGMLPAMGNITGRIYLLQRGGSALELEDGRIVASWCISIGPHATDIPGTDQVVVLRNMIEGEELDFLDIGNRSPVHGHTESGLLRVQHLDDWLPNAYLESFGCDLGEAENEELLELAEIRNEDWFDGPQAQPNYEPYDDDLPYVPYDAIAAAVADELAEYEAAHMERDETQGPLEPADAAMEEVAVLGEEIGAERHGPVERAVQQQLQNHFDERIVEEFGDAIQQWEMIPERELFEPLGPMVRYVPGRAPELFA
jgi:hypothetical protein